MSEPFPKEDRQRICEALYEGRRIEAIKLYRTLSGAGLKEAKEFVEGLEEELRAREAERFKTPERSGCSGALVLLLPVLLAALALLLKSCR